MTSLEDAEEGNSTRMGEEIPLIVTGVCRICLETDPIAELDEPCACKGSLQRVHPGCLQRWINERGSDTPPNSQIHDPFVCEICKQRYHQGGTRRYNPPPPRPPPSRSNLTRHGQEMYVIVVDPHTGIARARPIDSNAAFLEDDDADDDAEERHLNPLSSCAIAFFLFCMCFFLISHLFIMLPSPPDATGIDPLPPPQDDDVIPPSMDEQQAAEDAEFQDIGMTLLMLWLMMRLIVLVAPVYSFSRMLRARAARAVEAREGQQRQQQQDRGVELESIVVSVDDESSNGTTTTTSEVPVQGDPGGGGGDDGGGGGGGVQQQPRTAE